jgi:hypothetical protein
VGLVQPSYSGVNDSLGRWAMIRRHPSKALAWTICLGLAFATCGTVSSPAWGAADASAVARPEPPPPKPKPRGPGLSRVVQPGPASPISPDIDSYYNALLRGDCAQVRERTLGNGGEVGQLYAALADLCLGYLHESYQVDWPAAEIAYANSAGLDDCLSLAARDAVRRSLKRHLASGLARPSFGRAPLGTACEPKPTYVGLVAKEDGTGSSLIVLGLRMFEVTDVKVNGVWHPATSRNAIDGTECARADVLQVEPAPGDSVALRVRGTGYRTPRRTWVLGPVVTEEDVLNLDADACAPPTSDNPSSSEPTLSP